MTTAYQANDKYRATLRSGWVASPADTELAVTAIPTNLPTVVVVGWDTDYETVFGVTGTSGTNSSNYALTGVTRIKGANTNLPENTAVNCLNNEEFFNQYATMIADVEAIATGASADATSAIAIATGAAADVASIASDTLTFTNKRITKRVYSTTSTGTITLDSDSYDVGVLTAQAVTGAFQAPSGTPTDAQPLIIRIKDNGTARALTWASGTGGFVAGGSTLPSTTVTGKYLHVGFMYVTSNSLNKWMCIASQQEL